METTNLKISTRDNSGYIQTVDVQKVDNSFVGGNGTLTGINIYQIQPKIKTLFYSAYSNDGIANRLLSSGGSINFSTYNWGLGMSLAKNYWAYSTAYNRTIYYDYIDPSGNEGSHSMSLVANQYTLLKMSNDSSFFACINNFTVQPNVSGDYPVYISLSPSTINAIGAINYHRCHNGALMCPNNAIMTIDSIHINVNRSNTLIIDKHTEDGIRRPQGVIPLSVGPITFYHNVPSVEDFYRGQTLTMTNNRDDVSAQMSVTAYVLVKYF